VAHLLAGAARRLLGDPGTARGLLEDGARRGTVLLPAAATQCLAQLALLTGEAGDWPGAGRVVDRALQLSRDHELAERPAQAAVFSAAALVSAQNGAMTEAREAAKQAAFLVTMLVGIAPWAAIEARLLLARAAVLLGDPGAARMWVRDAEHLLRQYPDPGRLAEQLDAARAMAEQATAPAVDVAVALTSAELRVLRMLPTHLSFGEIAAELFVSRNTVKSQAIAVYRKFGVSSRAAAVDHARAAGILEP
jgi:LuxR family maltose regulon positive regulatory protein